MRFVFFDVGGTLIEPYPSVGEIYARAAASQGLCASAETLEQAFRTHWSRRMQAARNEPKGFVFGETPEAAEQWWRELVQEVLSELAFDGNREACFQAIYQAFARKEAWHVFEDVFPTLRALKAQKVGLGIISNWDCRLPLLLDSLGLLPSFDPVLVSGLEGVGKPSPALFERACKRIGVSPKEVAYVGDRADLDVAPAQALGLRCFLIVRKRRPKHLESAASSRVGAPIPRIALKLSERSTRPSEMPEISEMADASEATRSSGGEPRVDRVEKIESLEQLPRLVLADRTT